MLGIPQSKAPTQLNSIRATQSVQGVTIPVVMGTNRVQSRLIDYVDFKAIVHQNQISGKGLGGAQSTTTTYEAAVVALLCHGPIAGLLNVWDSTGRFTALNATEPFTIPGGGGNYTVNYAINYVNDQGVGVDTPYSFTADDYGSPGPVMYNGNYYFPMSVVASSPSAGEYTVDPVTGTYGFSSADAGKTVAVNYTYSLYYIQTTQTGTIPGSPYRVTVTNAADYYQDGGVIFYPSGVPLTLVNTTPTTGQYQYLGSGVYQFAAADTTKGIQISYTYRDTSNDYDSTRTLNLTVFQGNTGQAAWGYMSSNHPERALGYTQIAYLGSAPMQLGTAGEIPNYNYEIAGLYRFGSGIPDANPVDCINGILTSPIWGINFPSLNIDNWKNGIHSAYNYWAAASYFISLVLNQQQTAANYIQPILEAGNTAMIFSEGLLKLIPYGDTTIVANGYRFSPNTQPVVDLNDDNYIIKGAEEPVKVSRKAWQDAYNKVTIEFSDRTNGYNPNPVPQQNSALTAQFGLRSEASQAWHFITTQEAAKFAASTRLKRMTGIWNTYKFKLPWTYAYLEPMDLVTLTESRMGYNLLPVRITEIVDNPEDGSLDITAEEFPWGTSTATLYPSQAIDGYTPLGSLRDPGDTSAIIFEASNRLSKQVGDTAYIFASGNSPDWGGCNIWMSTDGTNYAQIAQVRTPGRIGWLGTQLPNHTDPDSSNTLNVVMTPDAELNSGTLADADNFVTLCAVCNTDGSNLELISYETATLVSGGFRNTYDLTYLRRGVYSTATATHNAGSLFARLDQASYIFNFDPSLYGQTVYFKFTSINSFGKREQPLSSVNAISLLVTGNNPGAIAAVDGTFLPGMDYVPDSETRKARTAAHSSYRPTTNPLTSNDNGGGTCDINVASFVMRCPGITNISVTGATPAITGLFADTLYWVYYDDADFNGGVVTFQASTNKEDALNGDARWFVGSIFTAALGGSNTIGNNDGGTGAQDGKLYKLGLSLDPLSTLNNGVLTTTNPERMLDSDDSNYATVAGTQAGSANSIVQFLLNPQAAVRAPWKSLTLKAKYEVTANDLDAPGGSPAFQSNWYYPVPTPHGGANVLNVNVNSGATGVQIASVPFLANFNLASIQINLFVQIQAACTNGKQISVRIYEVYFEAVL